MAFTRSTKFVTAFLLAAVSFFFQACGGDESVPAGKASSPTEAYKMLYTAVKAKKTEDIKMMLSKDTIKFAEGVAAQAKKSFDEQVRNGFTRTTFSPTMPEIRDERIKDTMGAVEVYNSGENKWEDLPFILEDGGWKLAVGNIFNGSWQRPGEPQSLIERKNANIANGNNMVPYGNGNLDSNANTANVQPIVPKPAQNSNIK